MRRQYAHTVTLVDGPSLRAPKGSEPMSPASTRTAAADKANEPKRIEISATTLPIDDLWNMRRTETLDPA
ncbi:hypothetical protein GCM10009582_27870 [Arthrobacter flavus]